MQGLKETLGAPETWGVVSIFDTLGKEERRAVERKDYITAVAIAIIASLGAWALSIVNVFTTIGKSIYKMDIEILKKGLKAEMYLLAMIFAFPVFAVQVGLGNHQALPFPLGGKKDLLRDQAYLERAMISRDESVQEEGGKYVQATMELQMSAVQQQMQAAGAGDAMFQDILRGAMEGGMRGAMYHRAGDASQFGGAVPFSMAQAPKHYEDRRFSGANYRGPAEEVHSEDGDDVDAQTSGRFTHVRHNQSPRGTHYRSDSQ